MARSAVIVDGATVLGVVIFIVCSSLVQVECENIHIGAVLSSDDNQRTFVELVERLNFTAAARKSGLTFTATTIIMDSNPIRSAMTICDDIIPKRVHVVIVSHPPSSNQSPISVSYTCGFYKIPVIGIYARDSAFSDKNVHPTFLRTVPPLYQQAAVWIDLLVHFGWKQVIFIHSMDEEGRTILSRFQALAEEKAIKIEKVVKFSAGITNFTHKLTGLQTVQSRVILLSAAKEDADHLYRDAAHLNLTRSDYVWLVTEEALSADSVPLGVVGVELINGSNEEAHLQDAVTLIGNGAVKFFKDAQNSRRGRTLKNVPGSCREQNDWIEGEIFREVLKSEVLEHGSTGRVSFNAEGDRLDPIYYIKNVQRNGRKSVGFHGNREGTEDNILNLSADTPIIWPDGNTTIPKGIMISTHLQVVTIDAKPFVETKELSESEEDREWCIGERAGYICNKTDMTTGKVTPYCCWGYCMDMLRMISERVNFTFDLHLSKDNSFGSFKRINGSKEKVWSGMMGELINGQSDLIVAPLTINPERAEYIDFSKPFKYQGLNILVKKEKKDSSLASFLQPFQDTLWILVGLSVHVVALVLYLLDRFSPFGRFKLAKSDDTEEDALNLSSAMWFAWGVLLNSGIGEGTPRSFSARVLGMVWAGFAMIIVASYTANLAAFLVLDRPDATISGIDDARLRNPNEEFKYATVRNSAVEMYFKRQVELGTMYRKMETTNVETAEEAIKAVKTKALQAFIWDSSRLEYEAANDCDLVVPGELFGRSGLGIGLRRGSPWTHAVSLVILELHEGGEMEKLDNKWILVESTACPEREHTPATLGLTNMAGVFMMVAGGIVAGVFLIFVEILYKRHRGLKEKELELARNAADRWRGNIAKRKTLRQTLQRQREEQLQSNSLGKLSSFDSNSTMTTPINRASFRQATGNISIVGGGAGVTPPVLKMPRGAMSGGRSVAPSTPSVLISNPAFSSGNRSEFV